MTVKIGIIGLGQIGASIGLALASRKDQVTTIGYDKSADVTRKAHKLEVVENFAHNLYACVKEADLVILALPIDQVYETLESIAQKIHEGAVVIDTAPAKQVVADWAKGLLPSNLHYVGLTPALNPACLEDATLGLNAARADLFHKGAMAISAAHGTAEGALKLATDFVTLLGALPFFADPEEVDGVMAATHILPGLSAAALVEAITSQPGWSDIRKLAGKPYSSATRPLEGEEPAALAGAILQNQSNTLRVLDAYIAALTSLRNEIASKNKNVLETRLEQARRGRAQWQLDRAKGDWLAVELGAQEMPKVGDILKQQFGGLDKLIGRRIKKSDEE